MNKEGDETNEQGRGTAHERPGAAPIETGVTIGLGHRGYGQEMGEVAGRRDLSGVEDTAVGFTQSDMVSSGVDPGSRTEKPGLSAVP